MGVVTLLVLVVGGESGSPLDRVLPEPVVMRIRMLTLREGMSQGEVVRRLGLRDRPTDFRAATVSNSRFAYSIGCTHLLRLDYTAQGRGISHGLWKATLDVKPAK
jgi:hypothetical protein